MRGIKENLINKRFGRLLVLEDTGTRKHRNVMWKCVCDCGNTIITYSHSLKAGTTQSCGCLKIEIQKYRNNREKHGDYGSELYWCWANMLQRCNNPKASGYKKYGGKGIKVCDEWKSYVNFHKWAHSNDYKKGLTIDRKDSDKNYKPKNCRWITLEENSKLGSLKRWYGKDAEITRNFYKKILRGG